MCGGGASGVHGVGVGNRRLIHALGPAGITNVTFHVIRRIRAILGQALLGVYG